MPDVSILSRARKKRQGIFNSRLLEYDLGNLLPELPAGIVAATVQPGCVWYWSLVAMVNGGAHLTCWSFVPRCCNSADTQTISEKENNATAGVVTLELQPLLYSHLEVL